MTKPPRNEAAVNALRMIPKKWALVILGLVIGYVVLQPSLNQWFGWNLPSVARMMGDEKPIAKTTLNKTEPISKSNSVPENGSTKDLEKSEEAVSSKKANTETPKKDSLATSPNRTSDPPNRTNEESKPQPPTPKTTPKSKADSNEADQDPLYGFLTEVGRNRYESPAGLVYGPGSEEGHRLKHIARHLGDQPDRPGSHGVFKGSMKAFLMTIDDAFSRAQKGAKGTTKKEDEGAIVYEATFDKVIGFIGGKSGGRKKNPPAKKIRLVIRGDNVITAFPF